MNWIPVESTVFEAAAYLHPDRLLYLKFRSGDIYRYFGFPLEQYHEFLAADSKGRYFSDCAANLCAGLQRPQAEPSYSDLSVPRGSVEAALEAGSAAAATATNNMMATVVSRTVRSAGGVR
jgi:hypothetical protein